MRKVCSAFSPSALSRVRISLSVQKGMTITLIADGTDEEEALEGLCTLIDSGFVE